MHGAPILNSAGHRVALFLVLTAAFTAPFWWYVGTHRGAPALHAGMYGLMWGPGFAALVVTRGAGLGWRWPGWRAALAAWAIPIGYVVVAYGVLYATGLARFAVDDGAAWLNTYYKATALSDGGVVALGLVDGATLGVLANLALALGEELGWRGFLSPALVPRLGVTGAGAVTGVVWAAWHFPLFFFHPLPGPPAWWQLGCFTLMATGVSIVLAHLRARTDSVWPAVIVHAAHNSFLASVDSVTGDTGTTAWFASETGVALVVPIAALAIALASAPDRLRQSHR
jgi:uncharacterized protein